eukprot:3333727-Rhodomonas_salina.1
MYHNLKVRHIDTSVYHLQELCKDCVLVLEKVSSAEQVADSLTKSTQKPAFEQHSNTMLGVQTMTSVTPTAKPMDVSKSDVMTDNVDEMEGIELGDENYEEVVESGLSAFEVSKSETRWCASGDGAAGPLAIHYAQCMVWMCNAEFYDFHVFSPWERDINQRDMQVEGA